MSEQKPIAVLMAEVMNEVRSVAKSDENSHFGFKFRGIDTVLEKVAPALRSAGVVTIPELLEQTTEERGKSLRVVVKVAYHFHGPAGDRLTAVVPGEAMDAQDKASSKAMSVAYRTALIQALAIPTGERDPHAGPPVSTKLAAMRQAVKAAATEKGWDNERLFGEYTQWSQGAEIGAADETDLQKFLDSLTPKRMQRNGGGGSR